MRRIINYHVVRKTDPSEMSNAVTKMLAQGWEILDGFHYAVANHTEVFVRVMVQYDKAAQ
jgi:hypothetical protein